MTFDEALKYLKEKKIRITPQRIAIIEFLATTNEHPTAEDIYRAIEKDFPGMSVATIYNNLRLFTEIGMIKEMSYGDASSHFDFHTEPHYHAICRKCGKIVDFYYPGLEDVEMAASVLTGFKVDGHRLEVYGLCPDCKKKMENDKHENHKDN